MTEGHQRQAHQQQKARTLGQPDEEGMGEDDQPGHPLHRAGAGDPHRLVCVDHRSSLGACRDGA